MKTVMGDYTWLLGSWRGHIHPLWIDPVLCLVAIGCGMLIGGERERREKPAGIRTLALVCLGSAVFTMLSFVFTTTHRESGRVSAQIVTGIGFLGAGVILHGRRIVSGVTTAAIIWVAAAVGMAVGAGYAVGAVALSLLINRLMVLIFLFETSWYPELLDTEVAIEFRPNGGLTQIRLERVLVDYSLIEHAAEWSDLSADRCRLTLRAKLAPLHLYELLAELAEVPDVCSITRELGAAARVTQKK